MNEFKRSDDLFDRTSYSGYSVGMRREMNISRKTIELAKSSMYMRRKNLLDIGKVTNEDLLGNELYETYVDLSEAIKELEAALKEIDEKGRND